MSDSLSYSFAKNASDSTLKVKYAKNSEPRCPVVLLLDTSGSMDGLPISQLNDAIMAFKEVAVKDKMAKRRIHLCIVTFGGTAKVNTEFTDIKSFIPPTLKSGGNTPLGSGINLALDELEKIKAEYKEHDISYFRPWVVLISDGCPTDAWKDASERAKKYHDDKEKKVVFLTFGVKGADFEILTEIAPHDKPPESINSADFGKLFLWLSASLEKASMGVSINSQVRFDQQ